MARFSKLCYGEIHSGIVSIFLDYATREGHLHKEKKDKKKEKKRKGDDGKDKAGQGVGT